MTTYARLGAASMIGGTRSGRQNIHSFVLWTLSLPLNKNACLERTLWAQPLLTETTIPISKHEGRPPKTTIQCFLPKDVVSSHAPVHHLRGTSEGKRQTVRSLVYTPLVDSDNIARLKHEPAPTLPILVSPRAASSRCGSSSTKRSSKGEKYIHPIVSQTRRLQKAREENLRTSSDISTGDDIQRTPTR